MESNSTYARFGISPDAVEIDKDEYHERYHDSTTPDDQRDHVDVTIEEETYSFCHEGDGPSCGEDDGTSTCEVVFADACLGLIGTVCPDATTRKSGRAGMEVNEIRIRPALSGKGGGGEEGRGCASGGWGGGGGGGWGGGGGGWRERW